jgi:hypothetical protein
VGLAVRFERAHRRWAGLVRVGPTKEDLSPTCHTHSSHSVQIILLNCESTAPAANNFFPSVPLPSRCLSSPLPASRRPSPETPTFYRTRVHLRASALVTTAHAVVVGGGGEVVVSARPEAGKPWPRSRRARSPPTGGGPDCSLHLHFPSNPLLVAVGGLGGLVWLVSVLSHEGFSNDRVTAGGRLLR